MTDPTPRQAALTATLAALRAFNAHTTMCTLCRVAQRPHNTTQLCAHGRALRKAIRTTAQRYAKETR